MKNLTLLTALVCFAAPFYSYAQTPETNHTVVRFDVLAAGTNFGKLDMELFDQEKPETVKNFLLYVYSGAYSNLILHRLVPNFVVQAGHIRVDNPVSLDSFLSYSPGANFGRITNEYAVGPELSNSFGTIAMARLSGQTNSASTDWYINLTNNVFLNTFDGGFTVFGRVVNTTDDRSGTNLLKYLNTLSSSNGIRSVTTTNPVESLNSLPVNNNRAGAAAYADLFTVQASFLQGGKPSEAVAPTVTVTQPADALTTATNATFTISGTAADNQELARVVYETTPGNSFIATGTTSWTAELALLYGTNHFSVHSVDAFGNVSTNIERMIVRRTPPAAINHTVVRFDIFAAGTNFGKLDIELFDQEKPETVRNFLLYAYGGSYSNLVLHRLSPNFALQGGHVRVEDPTSTNIFSSYTIGPDFGKITNEYGVGPELANDFGTIAVSQIPGATNGDWYINLANNASLNTNNNGFTVFGRVVNEMDDRSGIFLLAYFNTLAQGSGIRPTVLTNPSETLGALPVTTNRSGSPIYSDLFTVRTSFIQVGTPRDVVPPVLAITQPANPSITVTSSTFTLTGTASDNQEVARVLYDAGSEKSLFANGTTSWSVLRQLDFGTNRFSFRTVDNFGNVSAPVERIIVREERPADPAHTVVRFDILTNGTQFGRLDVELYDDAKPETVRNFLMYVYSGGYSNLVLYDLKPNHTLRAGSVLPDGTNGFHEVTYTPNVSFGATIDEYSVGSQIANEFGTIATAAVPGSPNAGSNSWHINLGNNSSFDTDPGGSTVFGRVVNTTDDRSGINLLRFFNTFQNGVNLRPIDSVVFRELGDLLVPVTIYRFGGFPYTSDMFLIRASIIQGGVARDNISPIVTINEPADPSLIVTTNATANLSGTATDNQQVARVIYDTPGGFAFPVNGRENWSKEVALLFGTNRVVVRAVDFFGNVGMAERTFFRSRLQPVAFRIEGKGKVTGITNDQTFLVGVNYTFTAKPGAGQYFLGWRGNGTSIFTRDRTLDLTMPEGLTNLAAVFSRTFVGLTNGAYRGFFYTGSNGPPKTSGAISFNLAPNGTYAGRLAPIGANFGIRGRFDTNVLADIQGALARTGIQGALGSDVLTLQLFLYPNETIQGTYDDGHFLSGVGLGHVKKFTSANPAPQAGSYSFLIWPTPLVGGYGFGHATIDTLGRIKMTGTLADGTAIKQSSVLLAGNVWPFYASAKAGRKVVLGFAGFNSNNVFNAEVRWFDSTFLGNTNQNTMLNGSPYVPPSQGPLFNWSNGVMSLSGGGLQSGIFANVTVDANGSFTFPSNTNNIQLSVPDAKGMITGSFIHPVTSALTPLKGAMLQSSNMAAGFFLNGASSGAFVIRGN